MPQATSHQLFLDQLGFRISTLQLAGNIFPHTAIARLAKEMRLRSVKAFARRSSWTFVAVSAPYLRSSSARAAQIHRMTPAGEVTLGVCSGSINLIEIAFGADGSLYALEFDSNGITTSGPGGSLTSLGLDGTHETIFNRGLIAPTGLEISKDGKFYVTTLGTAERFGQVLQIAGRSLPSPTLDCDPKRSTRAARRKASSVSLLALNVSFPPVHDLKSLGKFGLPTIVNAILFILVVILLF